MAWPDSNSTASDIDAKAGLLSNQHTSTHQALADWIKASETYLGTRTSVDPTSLSGQIRNNPCRNYIVNGAMAIAQRGNGSWTTGYGIDQWRNDIIGSTVVSTRQIFTPGATALFESEAYQRVVVTSSAGAGNYAILSQWTEDVRPLAGKTVTVSFYAKADAAKPIAIELTQNFGVGGSPSSEVTITPQKVTLSTSWARYTATIAVPSISGKTLGTANSTTKLNIWMDAGSSFNSRTSTLGQQSGTFEFWGVQIEVGATATPFEFENPAVTLQKCYRYYQKSYRDGTNGATQNGYEFAAGSSAVGNGSVIAAIKFPVVMRAVPAVNAYSYTSATVSTLSTSAGTDLAAGTCTPNVATEKGCNFTNLSGGNATPNLGGFIFHWAATAEL